MSEEKKIGVGFGVMILKKGKLLLGLRNDDAAKADSELKGEGTWTMPGGKLHFGESFERAAVREAKEETDLDVKEKDLKLISLTNDMIPTAHFVTVGFLCEKFSGKVSIMEPDEIVVWEWFTLDNLPSKVFGPSTKVLENYKKGKIY